MHRPELFKPVTCDLWRVDVSSCQNGKAIGLSRSGGVESLSYPHRSAFQEQERTFCTSYQEVGEEMRNACRGIGVFSFFTLVLKMDWICKHTVGVATDLTCVLLSVSDVKTCCVGPCVTGLTSLKAA